MIADGTTMFRNNTGSHLNPIDVTGMGEVSINGTIIRGRSITMTNGKIYVDGKEHVLEGEANRNVKIVLVGNLNGNISTSVAKVKVNGDVQGNVTSVSGDVVVTGNVAGSAKSTSGDVNVEGDVLTGSVSSLSGDVRVRKSGKSSRKSSSKNRVSSTKL
jgi:formylmethanofuran dehydrogenase subunit C